MGDLEDQGGHCKTRVSRRHREGRRRSKEVQVPEKIEFAREALSTIQHLPAAGAMKSGLEARLKCRVESDWKIMEWITELAGELLSRGQVWKGWPNRVLQIVRQEQRLSWRSASR